VRAGGELGGYVGAAVGGKMRRLAAEGVSPVEGRVNLDRYAFRQFEADRPLERLRRYQQDLLKHNSLRPLRRRPKLIGGVDVSYGVPSGGAHRAVAAYALVDREGRLVWSTAVEQPVSFPYISSYLAFRELPVLLSLLKEVRAADRLSEVVLVDGAGIMHPRRAGVATHLGIAAGVATIGVTKKLLCGHHDDRTMPAGELTPVVHAGQRVGSAVRPTAGSRRRIYISPGHGLTPDEADEIAAGMLTGRQLPEPIYWADRLSRGALGSSGK